MLQCAPVWYLTPQSITILYAQGLAVSELDVYQMSVSVSSARAPQFSLPLSLHLL